MYCLNLKHMRFTEANIHMFLKRSFFFPVILAIVQVQNLFFFFFGGGVSIYIYIYI